MENVIKGFDLGFECQVPFELRERALTDSLFEDVLNNYLKEKLLEDMRYKVVDKVQFEEVSFGRFRAKLGYRTFTSEEFMWEMGKPSENGIYVVVIENKSICNNYQYEIDKYEDGWKKFDNVIAWRKLREYK